MGVVLRAAGRRLDQLYNTRPASTKQLQAVNIYLRQFVADDDARFKLVAGMFKMEEIPSTTRVLTNGQASAILRLSNSSYCSQFDAYLRSLAESRND
jgi:hypothetical protein